VRVSSPDTEAAAGASRGAATSTPQSRKGPVPTPSAEFAGMSLDDLREFRHTLTEQETRVSYWRRIVQARIDLLDAGSSGGGVPGLSHLLADAPSVSRRLAHITIDPIDGDSPLPDLPALWATVVDASDDDAVAALLAELRDAERRLSSLRSELFARIDQATAELIARFHENPQLALMALPRR